MFPSLLNRTVIFGIAAALMFAANVNAQTVSDNPETSTKTGSQETGAFAQLSPGNQKIGQSLFDAQQAGDGDAAFSLDDIALAKQDGTGWGNVFKQMKDAGLVQERNIGQIISGQGKTDIVTPRSAANDSNTAHASSGFYRKPRLTKVVVTTANGNHVVVGLRKPGLRSKPLNRGNSSRMARGGRNSFEQNRTNVHGGRNAFTATGSSQASAHLAAGRTAINAGRSATAGRASQGGSGKGRNIK